MAVAESERSTGDRHGRKSVLGAGFTLDETKLSPPRLRPGIVPRPALVDLCVQTDSRVLAVVAPAGYGKSTLLAQWAARSSRRVAWLSADARDSDPAVLYTYLAVALDRVEAVSAKVVPPTRLQGGARLDVAPLLGAIASMREPVTIVVDNAEAIASSECSDLLSELVFRLPRGSRFALASRRSPPLAMARFRLEGLTLELGAEDLAMDEVAARELLAASGVDPETVDAEHLVSSTEGWPAGLYLAALAMKTGSPRAGAGTSPSWFSGRDPFMGDYLRSEFLQRVSRADASFLVRTSILEYLNGPLCDATLGSTRSGAVLDRLARNNLLVIPLDREGEWYRYHHLFRDLLCAELQRREPESIPELHARAADWYEASGRGEAAFGHAQQASDPMLTARILLDIAQPAWASGRIDTVLGWFEWFARNQALEAHPAIAAHGALLLALVGRASDAERWAVAAGRGSFRGRLSDGNTMEATLAYMNALMCRNGIAAMSEDADAALEGLNPFSPYRAAMMHAKGLAHLLTAEYKIAGEWFERAFEEAKSASADPFAAVLLTEHALVAEGQDAQSESDALAARAVTMLSDGRFDGYWTSSLVYARAAQAAARSGDLGLGEEYARRASMLRPLLTSALPVVSVQALVELARAYLALADPAGARAAFRQAQGIQRQTADLGTLAQEIQSLGATLETLKFEMLGLSSLTSAELRLIPYLSTHLTMGEIGDRLFVSRNTVKSQAISIYRKLDVSSRTDAIERLQRLGMAAQS